MNLLDALKQCDPFPIPVATSAWASDVLGKLPDYLPHFERVFHGPTVHLNWMATEEHKARRFDKYKGQWFCTYAPPKIHHSALDWIENLGRPAPAFAFIDAEHVKGTEQDVAEDMLGTVLDFGIKWGDANLVFWGHYSWHNPRSTGVWQQYNGVPLHPPFCLSPALYSAPEMNRESLWWTVQQAERFDKKVVPYVQFKSTTQAKDLGARLAFWSKIIPACCIYREAGKVADGWPAMLLAFREGFARAFKRVEKV